MRAITAKCGNRGNGVLKDDLYVMVVDNDYMIVTVTVSVTLWRNFGERNSPLVSFSDLCRRQSSPPVGRPRKQTK